MKIRPVLFLPLLLAVACTQPASDEWVALLDQVQALNVGRSEYVLGRPLTASQKEKARENPLEASAPGTYKFKDDGLQVVVDRKTERAIVIYEQLEQASRQTIRGLVGDLFLDFGPPTIFTHNQVIYWAYGPQGKLSEKQFHTAKEKKENLNILATVKLNSTMKIMGGSDPSADAEGGVYYIISSPPAMEMILPAKE